MERIEDVFLHQVAAPGLPGHITAPEAAAIRADIALIRDAPRIEKFTDIPDVTGEPAEGQVYIWDAEEGVWVPGSVSAPLRVATNYAPVVERQDVSFITLGPGLTIDPNHESPRVHITPQWGGTGTSDTVARADHGHAQYLAQAFDIPATGSFSSGTRTLVTATVTGLLPERTYVLKGELILDMRGEGSGAGRSTPRVTIDGNTYPRHVSARTVAGVDRSTTTRHRGVWVNGATQVTVVASIQFNSGDPVYLDAGRLYIDIDVNR